MLENRLKRLQRESDVKKFQIMNAESINSVMNSNPYGQGPMGGPQMSMHPFFNPFMMNPFMMNPLLFAALNQLRGGPPRPPPPQGPPSLQA
jgi:hypothetical protein